MTLVYQHATWSSQLLDSAVWRLLSTPLLL